MFLFAKVDFAANYPHLVAPGTIEASTKRKLSCELSPIHLLQGQVARQAFVPKSSSLRSNNNTVQSLGGAGHIRTMHVLKKVRASQVAHC